MNGITNPAMKNPYASVTPEVSQHRRGFLVVGILMIVLGTAAIAFPFAATLATELFVGWILAISGVLGIVQAFRASRWKGFLWSLLGALLALGVGILLLFYPLTGILSLTFLLTVFFISGGILRIILAFRLRPHDHWGWLLVSGILALLLAALILSRWPVAAAWVIGLLVGIDLIFTGLTSVMLSMAARRSGLTET